MTPPGTSPSASRPHGSLGDRLHRQKKYDVLTGLLKRIRDRGVLVGLSAHDPTLIEIAEEKGWDVDYYMCSLYFRTRTREEYRAILGDDLPLGEIYLPSDPPRMFKAIRAVSKPCLAYKLLAAGRRIGTPAEVRRCFEEAFANLKPTDAAIVGMYQQFGDQVAENAGDRPRDRLEGLIGSDQLADRLAVGEDGDGAAGEVRRASRGIDAQVSIDRGEQVLRSEGAIGGVFTPLDSSLPRPVPSATRRRRSGAIVRPASGRGRSDRRIWINRGVRPNSPTATTRIFWSSPLVDSPRYAVDRRVHNGRETASRCPGPSRDGLMWSSQLK